MSDSERTFFSPSALEIVQARAESLAQIADSGMAQDIVSLLLFRLGDEWYAVAIGSVREILQEYEVTSIPCLPSYVLGVINIRGEIVSVTDVARQMGLGGASEEGERVAIVVSDEGVTTALVVDAIGDIVEVPRESIEPPLPTLGKGQAECVGGCVYVDGELIGVLNVSQVLEPIGAHKET